MGKLIDGYTDSLEAILGADPIEPELDANGNPKAIPWKMSFEQTRDSGLVATAEVSGWKYEVIGHKYRVTAKKIKEVPKTPEELIKGSTVVKLEDTQTPGYRDKTIVAAGGKPSSPSSAEEKKALEDAKTVAANAPDAKTKKEAESLLKSSKK